MSSVSQWLICSFPHPATVSRHPRRRSYSGRNPSSRWIRSELTATDSTSLRGRPAARSGLRSLVWREGFLQEGDERRQVQANDLPEDVEVNRIVAVNQAVPKTDELWPWDVRLEGLHLRGDAVRGLADDLQETHESKVEKAIIIQIGAGSTLG